MAGRCSRKSVRSLSGRDGEILPLAGSETVSSMAFRTSMARGTTPSPRKGDFIQNSFQNRARTKPFLSHWRHVELDFQPILLCRCGLNTFYSLRVFGSSAICTGRHTQKSLATHGEFAEEADVPWSVSDLVRTLDALITDLRGRNREILLLRLGGDGDQVPTLGEVGAKFRLTRERVRQILKRSVEQIGKRGGRRLRMYVEHVESACREKVCPLTPALLKTWLGNPPAASSLNLIFYIRLLAAVNPAISAWPTGQADAERPQVVLHRRTPAPGRRPGLARQGDPNRGEARA
jgi:hypothetical protein